MPRLLLVFAVALLVALGLWWSRGDGGVPLGVEAAAPLGSVPDETPLRAHSGVSDADVVQRVESKLPPWIGDLIESEALAEPAMPSTGTIAGRVAWKDGGMPVAGARVRLQRAPRDTVIPEPGEDQAPPEDDPATTATTDHLGQFVLAYVPHRETLFLRFELQDGTVEIADLRTPPEEGARAWQGEYLLEARGTIVGQLVGPQGEPVGNVRIRAVDDLRFDDPTVPEEVREGRIAGAETLRPATGRALSLRERLLPYPTAVSRRDGTFTVHGVREGAVHLLLQHEDLVSRRVDVPVVGGRTTDVGTIALGRGVAFAVRLLDTSLRPLAGLSVAVTPSGWRFGPPPARTGADGIATFHLDLTETDERAAELNVGASVRRAAGMSWAALGTAALPGATWVLSSRDAFDVALATSDGSLPDRVQFGTRPEAKGFAWRGTGGWYRVSGIPAEAFTVLYAAASGYAPSVQPVLRTPGFPMRFALDAKGDDFAPVGETDDAERSLVRMTLVPTFRVRLRVVDDHRQPIAGVRVTFTAGTSARWRDVPGVAWGALVGDWRLGTTGADGEIVAEGLWDTRVRFTAWHVDRGRVHLEVDGLAQDQLVEIRMLAPARVTGIVLDQDRPVTRRFRLRLEPPRLPPGGEPVGVELYDAVECTTNDDGRFEIPRVGPWPWPTEAWVLRLADPAVPDAGSAFRLTRAGDYLRDGLRLEPGQRVDVSLELTASSGRSRVTGTVRLGGAAAVGAIVECWSLEPRTRAVFVNGKPRLSTVGPERVGVSVTDGEGRFRFEDPQVRGPDSEVRVAVVRHGRSVEIARVRVEPGERRGTWKPVAIDLQVGELALTLRDQNGDPLANRPVALVADSGARFLVVADAGGTVRESDLPAQSYRVIAADGRGGEIEFAPDVVVPPGSSAFETRDAPRR